MRRHLYPYGTLSILALTLSGLGLPSAAPAQTAESTPRVFHACYVPSSGVVYRIKEPGLPDACRGNGAESHIEFQWTDGLAGRDHGLLSGLLDDDHPQYLKADGSQPLQGELTVTGGAGSTSGVRIGTDGSILAEGVLGSGSIPTDGAGARMMWYPAKAALRAGSARSTEWDDGNIGEHSVALGQHPIASGASSFAVGFVAKATGGGSVALGPQAEAAGIGSLAHGSLSQASGEWSVSIGQGSNASGKNATALGKGASASGENATAFGLSSRATGSGSTALGGSSTASGPAAVALGEFSVASGQESYAFGRNVTASGTRSIAIGNYASTDDKTGAIVISANDGFSTVEVKAASSNQFVARAGHFWLGSGTAVTAPAGHLLTTSSGAYLSTGGTWTNSSDVSRKENFETVDAEEVLGKIADMSIRSWSYKGEAASVRHVGPTAQDFHGAFGLGDGETAIATVDADGINLLAVQALEKRTAEQARTIQALQAENQLLQQRLARIEAALRRLADIGSEEASGNTTALQRVRP